VADPYPIRTITEDEFDTYEAVTDQAFALPPPSAEARPRIISRLEFDRCLAAFDGVEMVGTALVFSFLMSPPGGPPVPTAGVSWVSVLPTYRRRGIMDSLMRRQLQDIRDRGELIAALLPTETPLYGRYGYGMAIRHASFTVRRGEGGLAPDVPSDPAIRLRIVAPADARREMENAYDAAAQSRPGLFVRNKIWWDRVLRDRGGTTPLACLLAEDADGPRGYALYSADNRWEDEDFLHDCTLTVTELVAADPATGAALWRDLLSRDLVTEVRARRRPADDPLLFQLADSRRVRARVSDGLWTRVIDVPGALSARRYACPIAMVIEVRDELLPGNAGRWYFAGGDSGAASCERTTAAPDVSVGVRELGAAYLGGTRLGALAGAGLIAEHRKGAVTRLSAALSWDPSPWCATDF
jgi:predicted acetyltransferase